MTTRRELLAAAAAWRPAAGRQASRVPPPGEIRAFSIDFNWYRKDGKTHWVNAFAPPGLWAGADPGEHFAW